MAEAVRLMPEPALITRERVHLCSCILAFLQAPSGTSVREFAIFEEVHMSYGEGSGYWTRYSNKATATPGNRGTLVVQVCLFKRQWETKGNIFMMYLLPKISTCIKNISIICAAGSVFSLLRMPPPAYEVLCTVGEGVTHGGRCNTLFHLLYTLRNLSVQSINSILSTDTWQHRGSSLTYKKGKKKSSIKHLKTNRKRQKDVVPKCEERTGRQVRFLSHGTL